MTVQGPVQKQPRDGMSQGVREVLATRTRKRGKACGGRPECGGEWAAKTGKRPRTNQHNPQCANMVRRVAVSSWGPGQSPVLPFACCVGSLRSGCGLWSCWCRFRARLHFGCCFRHMCFLRAVKIGLFPIYLLVCSAVSTCPPLIFSSFLVARGRRPLQMATLLRGAECPFTQGSAQP